MRDNQSAADNQQETSVEVKVPRLNKFDIAIMELLNIPSGKGVARIDQHSLCIMRIIAYFEALHDDKPGTMLTTLLHNNEDRFPQGKIAYRFAQIILNYLDSKRRIEALLNKEESSETTRHAPRRGEQLTSDF